MQIEIKDNLITYSSTTELQVTPAIAALASKIASVEPVEIYRYLTTRALETVLSLMRLDSLEVQPQAVISHLLENDAVEQTKQSLMKKDLFDPYTVPIPLVDRMIELALIPSHIRQMHYARIICHLAAMKDPITLH